MNKAILVCILALASKVYCEPPSGYAYRRPSSFGNFNNHGFSSFGNSLGHGSSDYQQVSIGHQNSEGFHIDPHLLHKIKDILIQQENLNGGGAGNSFGHGISNSYGPPSSSYGPPSHSHSSRVVGIDFAHVEQGRQVAQYLKHDSSSSFAPSRSYGLPSFRPFVSRPSSSYGAPF